MSLSRKTSSRLPLQGKDLYLIFKKEQGTPSPAGLLLHDCFPKLFFYGLTHLHCSDSTLWTSTYNWRPLHNLNIGMPNWQSLYKFQHETGVYWQPCHGEILLLCGHDLPSAYHLCFRSSYVLMAFQGHKVGSGARMIVQMTQVQTEETKRTRKQPLRCCSHLLSAPTAAERIPNSCI